MMFERIGNFLYSSTAPWGVFLNFSCSTCAYYIFFYITTIFFRFSFNLAVIFFFSLLLLLSFLFAPHPLRSADRKCGGEAPLGNTFILFFLFHHHFSLYIVYCNHLLGDVKIGYIFFFPFIQSLIQKKMKEKENTHTKGRRRERKEIKAALTQKFITRKWILFYFVTFLFFHPIHESWIISLNYIIGL